MNRLLAGFLLGLVFCTPGIAQETFEFENKIDALVKPYLENEKFNCVSIGIAHNGKTWTLHYGHVSKNEKTQPNADTIYEIGSISKVFTSLLLADAVVQGKARLAQPIGDFLQDVKESNPKLANSITLQHLSQHMSGLPRMPSNFAPADAENPFADYDRALLIEYLKNAKPSRKPEEKSEYSNLAAGLLGDLLAAESGLSYEALLTDRILKPLGMNDTSMTLTDDQRSRMAPPQNSALLPDHTWDFGALAGAGGIRSSVNDMLQFITANLDRPDNETGEALSLAWKQQLPAGKGHLAMGLGWMIAGDGSTRWHNGQTGGYHSMLLISRKHDAGVVFLSNTADSGIDALAQTILQTLAGMNVKPKTFSAEKNVDAAIVSRLVGKYQLAPRIVITVTANGNKMMVQLTGQSALGVTAESETVWNLNDVVAQLRFDLPKSGPANSVTLHQNGQVLPAPRIKD